MTATKLDPARELGRLYKATTTPVLVDVPPLAFLALDGRGAPESSAFAEAVQALYAVAYTAKFALKKERGVDYRVMPLEGLWEIPGATAATAIADAADAARRESWHWTLLVLQPEIVTAEVVEAARAKAAAKVAEAPLAAIRLESFAEGCAAQIIHVGPYAFEAATVERLQAFIAAEGRVSRGRHHEIYLGDPRRTVPERLRTIIRHPC